MTCLLSCSAASTLGRLILTARVSPVQLDGRLFRNPKYPGLHHCRSSSILGSLSDNRGAYNKRIRRGRGPASGKGKTSGRGHKGQKQHGKVPAGFTGGQTPLEVVKGRRGFENQFSIDLATLNVDRLQSWIDQGRLDVTRPITIKDLHESRCLHGIKDGVKLLARNAEALQNPVHITVSRASASAIAAIEAAGGSVTTRYYTRSSIRNILCGLTHPTMSLMSRPITPIRSRDRGDDEAASGPTDSAYTNRLARGSTPPPEDYRYRLSDATSRKDLEYYRDPAHRGYLSYQVDEGQGPSLFFKTSNTTSNTKASEMRKVRSGSAAKEGRIW